jgi:hypothetical protein
MNGRLEVIADVIRLVFRHIFLSKLYWLRANVKELVAVFEVPFL